MCILQINIQITTSIVAICRIILYLETEEKKRRFEQQTN